MSLKIKIKPPSIESSAEPPQKQAALQTPAQPAATRPKIRVIKPTSPKRRPSDVKKPLKITLNPTSKPKVKKVIQRIRVKPTRIPGEGYDSEDSEIEDDPLIEEGLILRLLPDAELDYVKQAVETGDFSNFQIKWKDSKRALIFINNSIYGAKLVRLPNTIEVQKTVDKKNLFKTIDVSQILLVVKRLNSEEEIKEIVVQDDETLDSGIAPPLRHVMQSKQRKNLNNSHIQSLEAKVDELLRLDEEAEDSHFELIDPESLNRESVVNTPQYFPHEQELVPQELLQTSDDSKTSDQVDDLELEIEQVLGEDELLLDGETGVEGEEGEEEEVVVEAEEDEESDDDDDDDDDDDNDNSDNEQGVSRKVEVDENEQHNALLRDEINELMSTIEQNKARLEKTHNPLLQSRVLDSINKLEKELENKKRQLKTGEDKTRKEQQDDEQTSRNTTSNNGDGEREDDEDEDENGQLGEEDDEDEDDDDELDELFG